MMASQASVIECYQQLLRQSQRMAEFARQGDWTNLVMEKSLYLVELESVTQCERRLGVEGGDKLRRACLLEQILELEAEIRSCLLARRDELGRLIDVSRRQIELGRAYRPELPAGPGFDGGCM
ncbi:flagellar protein FliT [Geopseudomonas aromaticivorans]|nr:flagellar protein FliT [Pseudomonas aromaticivorans]